MKLYHVAGFVPVEGGEIVLHPGKQNSTGVGVYFTEGFPQLRYAGGEINQHVWEEDFIVVFEIESDTTTGWWRAKNKVDRPRFWHSNGQVVTYLNTYVVETIDGYVCHMYREVLG